MEIIMFFKTITKTALLGTVFVLTSIASAISAPNIPCSTAKLIVPWGAGGGTDVIFRQFVDNINKAGAKPQLQVVNINGQGGNKDARWAHAGEDQAYYGWHPIYTPPNAGHSDHGGCDGGEGEG